MSKINSIQPNYQSKAKSGQDLTKNFASKQSFGAGKELLTEEDQILKACKKGMNTKMMQLSDLLAQNEGEVETQLINNTFTATLAPLMIAFNPFSKKDKKDKEYLSLRQPISAGIAMAVALPATIQINKVFAKWGSQGYFKNLDMRICPHKDYLKDDFKTEYKKVKHKDNLRTEFEEKIGLDSEVSTFHISKNPIKKFLLYPANLKNAYYKKIQGETIDFFAKMINVNCGENMKDFESRFSIDDKGIISILDEKGNVIAENSKAIPNLTKPEQLKEYLKTNSVYKRTFGDFMRDNFGFESHSDSTMCQDSTVRKLKELEVPKFLEKFGLLDKSDAETLAKLVSVARQGQTLKEYKKAGAPANINWKEIIEANAKLFHRDVQSLLGEKLLEHANMSMSQLIDRFHMIKVDESVVEKLNKELKDKDKIAQEIGKLEMANLQELMNMPIDQVMLKFKKLLITNGMNDYFKKTKDTDVKDITQIVKRYAKSIAGKSSENFKNAMKFQGMASNIFLTVLTCTILNWAYPRFVEWFFPSLAKSDKPSEAKKGGN